MTPFRQGRFADLPDTPVRPHAWHAAAQRTVRVTTAALGTTATHVRVMGAGPPLLLVHGLMTSSYSWRYALPALGERFTCYAPDLPGAGRTDPPQGLLRAPDLADWLHALAEALGIAGAPVIGNSMGGYVCLWWARRHPGAIARLVDLHSPGVPMARLWALNTALRLPGAERLLAALVQRDVHRWAHRNVHYWDESLKSVEEAREYGDVLATSGGLRAFASYLRDTLDPRDMRRLLADPPVGTPLLLVYAERDPMVPPRVGDALHRALPGSELVRLAEASHFAHVDATDRFVDAVLPFLTA